MPWLLYTDEIKEQNVKKIPHDAPLRPHQTSSSICWYLVVQFQTLRNHLMHGQ